MRSCLSAKVRLMVWSKRDFCRMLSATHSFSYFAHGVYLSMYPPGKHNTDSEGNPKDTLGADVKYSCSDVRCNNKRKMGYKEFTIHMANEHGGLEVVLMEDEREEIRNLVEKIRKK